MKISFVSTNEILFQLTNNTLQRYDIYVRDKSQNVDIITECYNWQHPYHISKQVTANREKKKRTKPRPKRTWRLKKNKLV